MLKSVETLGVYALNHIGTLALRELSWAYLAVCEQMLSEEEVDFDAWRA